MLSLVQEVMVLVVGLESLSMLSLLGALPLVLNTGMGGVVVWSWKGGTVHDFFCGFGPPLVSEGWFPHKGYHGGVEFAGRSPPRDQYEYGRGRSFESQRGYRPLSFFRGTRTPPMGQEWSSQWWF
jgi:hypothetical protein